MKALYYPHTEIRNPVVLRNALLLWDNIETIVPNRDWKSTRLPLSDRMAREAQELVVLHRIPTEAERDLVYEAVTSLSRQGQLGRLIQADMTFPWHRQEYLIYPDKFSKQTWRMLEQGGMARWVQQEADYGVPAALGFLMMSLLADVCAGTQLYKVTDRTQAYSWLAEQHARVLGTQYVTGLDVSQVAPSHDRLVTLSLDVVDGRAIPLKKLVALRKREIQTPGSGYSAMRRRFAKSLQNHLTRVAKEARSVNDVQELDRQYKDELKDDLNDLKAELGLANRKALFSKEVALSALILAGTLVEPIAGLTALGREIGGIGVIPLMKAAVDFRGAKRDAFKKHTMSWLFLAKQNQLTLY